ncbi:MAG: GNAT family N-acetyltransferase [Cytophagaceae bacterium]
MTLKIQHDQLYKKFFVNLAGRECILRYERFDGILDLRTLFVPQNLRGKGIGKKVIEYSIKFARKNNLKIKTTCSFVKNYFDTHPEVSDLVVQRNQQPKLQYQE